MMEATLPPFNKSGARIISYSFLGGVVGYHNPKMAEYAALGVEVVVVAVGRWPGVRW
jgi:hypothetical protein